jgi:hypothetical protein
MQYILLALMYFVEDGGIMMIIHVAGSQEQKGSDCMENLIIIVSAQRSLQGVVGP